MRILSLNVPLGFGDLIFFKSQLDNIKDKYDEIRISYDNNILQSYRNNNSEYASFLNEIGDLFFNEFPYKLNIGQFKIQWPSEISKTYNIPMVLPKLQHLLCKGSALNIDQEYIILTTKIRYVNKNYYINNIYHQFWALINELSKKYKIVIMGERIVEMNKEYNEHGSDAIYSIYNDILKEIPSDKLLDLTIAALGITSPSLKAIQQDCMVMSQAKSVISFGIGGNLQISVAVANTLNFQMGSYPETDMLYGNHKEYDNSMITKDLSQFFNKLKSYI